MASAVLCRRSPSLWCPGSHPTAGTGAVQVTSIRSTLRLFLTPRWEGPLSLKLEAAPNGCGSVLMRSVRTEVPPRDLCSDPAQPLDPLEGKVLLRPPDSVSLGAEQYPPVLLRPCSGLENVFGSAYTLALICPWV